MIMSWETMTARPSNLTGCAHANCGVCGMASRAGFNETLLVTDLCSALPVLSVPSAGKTRFWSAIFSSHSSKNGVLK